MKQIMAKIMFVIVFLIAWIGGCVALSFIPIQDEFKDSMSVLIGIIWGIIVTLPAIAIWTDKF